MTRARDVANLIGSGNYSSTTFTATAGQTVFSIAHTQNFVQVFMNGLLLDLTVDYTSNGSAVTLTSGAAVGDEIEVVAYNTFSVGDALNQAAADTRYVNTAGDNMSGNLTITTNDNSNQLILKSTDDDASIGPVLEFNRSSSSPADNDQIGRIDMVGKNDADQDVDYVVYVNQIRDATDGTEDGRMAINTVINGTMSSRMNVEPTETVFNDESNDLDFRVESNSNANMLFVDGGNNNVTMRSTSAGASTTPFIIHNGSSNANTDVRMLLAPCTTAADRPVILAATNNGSNICHFTVSTPNGGTPAERLRIDGVGNVFINTLNDMGGILNTSNADGIAIGSANDQTYYRRIYGTSGSNLTLKFWNGSNEGSLNSSGAWVNASDVSLKENIADIEYGVDTVKSLKPRKYTMKKGGDSEIGFVAQEMESVVPEVVTTSENPDGDEIKGISYGQLTAVLTKALQEAIAEIEILKTKVAALEGG